MKLRSLLGAACDDLTVAIGNISSEGSNKLIVEFTTEKGKEPFTLPVDPEKFYKLMADQYTGKAKVAYRNPKNGTVVTEADYVDRRDETPVKATEEVSPRGEKCPKHKKYQGLRKPRGDDPCPTCLEYYTFVRNSRL